MTFQKVISTQLLRVCLVLMKISFWVLRNCQRTLEDLA